MKSFRHTDIATQYHALYSDDVFTRVAAWDAEDERQMRECMGNRDNYDLDEVRAVVAYHVARWPNLKRTQVAKDILAERLAEPMTHGVDIAFADAGDMEAIVAVNVHNVRAKRISDLIAMREAFKAEGNDGLADKATVLINAICEQ